MGKKIKNKELLLGDLERAILARKLDYDVLKDTKKLYEYKEDRADMESKE